ncbi:hypothetical protein LINGRAHAP2_LOCUS35705 [Linum grandiflorum]
MKSASFPWSLLAMFLLISHCFAANSSEARESSWTAAAGECKQVPDCIGKCSHLKGCVASYCSPQGKCFCQFPHGTIIPCIIKN